MRGRTRCRYPLDPRLDGIFIHLTKACGVNKSQQWSISDQVASRPTSIIIYVYPYNVSRTLPLSENIPIILFERSFSMLTDTDRCRNQHQTMFTGISDRYNLKIALCDHASIVYCFIFIIVVYAFL